jgi:hypothetical protein
VRAERYEKSFDAPTRAEFEVKIRAMDYHADR